jgi:hypothetical protein
MSRTLNFFNFQNEERTPDKQAETKKTKQNKTKQNNCIPAQYMMKQCVSVPRSMLSATLKSLENNKK